MGDVKVAAHRIDQRLEAPPVERRVPLLDVAVAGEVGASGAALGEVGLEPLQLPVELEHLAGGRA